MLSKTNRKIFRETANNSVKWLLNETQKYQKTAEEKVLRNKLEVLLENMMS